MSNVTVGDELSPVETDALMAAIREVAKIKASFQRMEDSLGQLATTSNAQAEKLEQIESRFGLIPGLSSSKSENHIVQLTDSLSEVNEIKSSLAESDIVDDLKESVKLANDSTQQVTCTNPEPKVDFLTLGLEVISDYSFSLNWPENEVEGGFVVGCEVPSLAHSIYALYADFSLCTPTVCINVCEVLCPAYASLCVSVGDQHGLSVISMQMKVPWSEIGLLLPPKKPPDGFFSALHLLSFDNIMERLVRQHFQMKMLCEMSADHLNGWVYIQTALDNLALDVVDDILTWIFCGVSISKENHHYPELIFPFWLRSFGKVFTISAVDRGANRWYYISGNLDIQALIINNMCSGILMGDEFLSAEHLVLAFLNDQRFGKQLFRNLHLSEKELKETTSGVCGIQRVTDQICGMDKVVMTLSQYLGDIINIELTDMAGIVVFIEWLFNYAGWKPFDSLMSYSRRCHVNLLFGGFAYDRLASECTSVGKFILEKEACFMVEMYGQSNCFGIQTNKELDFIIRLVCVQTQERIVVFKLVEKRNKNEVSQVYEAELEEGLEKRYAVWDNIYHNTPKTEKLNFVANEIYDAELEKIGHPLCIYETYGRPAAWSLLHHGSVYRGLSLMTIARRSGSDDDNVVDQLPLLNEKYYMDLLCEIGGMFSVASKVDNVHKRPRIGFQSWHAIAENVSLSSRREETIEEAIQEDPKVVYSFHHFSSLVFDLAYKDCLEKIFLFEKDRNGCWQWCMANWTIVGNLLNFFIMSGGFETYMFLADKCKNTIHLSRIKKLDEVYALFTEVRRKFAVKTIDKGIVSYGINRFTCDTYLTYLLKEHQLGYGRGEYAFPHLLVAFTSWLKNNLEYACVASSVFGLLSNHTSKMYSWEAVLERKSGGLDCSKFIMLNQPGLLFHFTRMFKPTRKSILNHFELIGELQAMIKLLKFVWLSIGTILRGTGVFAWFSLLRPPELANLEDKVFRRGKECYIAYLVEL